MRDTGSVHVSYCWSLPPTYCLKQRPLLQLTRDPCIMLNKAALLLLELNHKGPGLFLLGSTYCFVIPYWQLSSGAQQSHSAYSPCHSNNIHPERLGEETTTLVHCLQHITSRICKRSGWTINPNVNLTNFRCSGPVTPCSDISQVLHVCLELL